MAKRDGSIFDRVLKGGRGGRRQTEPAPPQPAQPAPSQPAPGGGAELPPEGTVTVEYSPALDGDPDPGDVVWIWVPYEEDPTQGKDRPLVVIGRRHHTVVGVPLTTKQPDREPQIEVGTGDWDPKRRVSYARIWRMMDIDPTQMRREGAIIDRGRFDHIVAAVDKYYDVRYATSASTSSTSGSPASKPADDDY